MMSNQASIDNENSPNKIKNTKKKITKIFLAILALSFLVFIYKYFGIGSLITEEKIKSLLLSFGPWVPVAYIIVFTIAMVFNLPCSIFLGISGFIFGPLWGVFWGLFSCTFSGIFIFKLANKLGFSAVQDKFGKKMSKFNDKIEKDGFIFLFLVRMPAIIPFSIISYAAGFTSIKLRDYIAGTVLGCFPLVLLWSYLMPPIANSIKDINLKKISSEQIMVILKENYTIGYITNFGIMFSIWGVLSLIVFFYFKKIKLDPVS